MADHEIGLSLPFSVNFITDAPQENCTADRSLLCKTKGSVCAIKRESWNLAEAPPQNAIIYIYTACVLLLYYGPSGEHLMPCSQAPPQPLYMYKTAVL